MELSEDAKFQLVSGIPKTTSLDRVQVLVKSEFVLKPDSFLIAANDHAVHGHMYYGSHPKGNKIGLARLAGAKEA